MTEWTIDASVLSHVDDDDDMAYACFVFLATLPVNEGVVCLDEEGVIEKRYKELASKRKNSPRLKKWISSLTKQHVQIRKVKNDEGLKTRVLNLGVFQDDLIYVLTSLESPDKCIVSVNKTFGCDCSSKMNNLIVKSEVKRGLGVIICHPEEIISKR